MERGGDDGATATVSWPKTGDAAEDETLGDEPLYACGLVGEEGAE